MWELSPDVVGGVEAVGGVWEEEAGREFSQGPLPPAQHAPAPAAGGIVSLESGSWLEADQRATQSK